MTNSTPAPRRSLTRSSTVKRLMAERKAQGETLGNPDNLTHDAQIDGALTNKNDAIEAYEEVAGIAECLRKDGLSFAKIATKLNE